MTKSEIKIPLKIIHQLLEHAQSSVESEVCGVLGGVEGIAVSCYPVENAHPNPRTKFRLDASEQIAAFKTLREKDEQLFAIYHSHPTSEAYPSVTDLAQSHYPETLCLIISLKTKGVLEIRGFYLIDRKIEEVSLLLGDE